jgi:hypothetical protein
MPTRQDIRTILFRGQDRQPLLNWIFLHAAEALVWARIAATERNPELAGVIYDLLAEAETATGW